MRRRLVISGGLLAVLGMAPLVAQQPTGSPTGTIRGRVVESATQQPLAGASVTAGTQGALTQADGRYVITGVPAGTGAVRARMLGYSAATQPVSVAGGDTAVVDFALNAQAVGLAAVVVTGYGA